jgi:probable phosphoglycerate mutase
MEQHIFIIRHGETDYNKEGIIQGRGVDTELNEEGRRQADLFYKKYQQHPFDKVYTSALKRSRQSVDGFIRKGIPWEARPELDEIDWGEQEGMKTTTGLRQLYKKVTRAWRLGRLEVRIPGGENILELTARQRKFLRVLDGDAARNILICTHGRAMRSLLCLMLGDDLSAMQDYPHANLSLYRLLRNKSGYHLVLRHDTSHLR